MYLSSFRIRGIKCFDEEQKFVFPKRGDGSYGGWHVILGANASGKTTVLRAIATCLLGSDLAIGDPVGWVRKDQMTKYGSFEARVTKGVCDVADRNQKGPFYPKVYVTPDATVEILGEEYDRVQYVNGVPHIRKKALLTSMHSSKKGGWFSCGYGPFRRLSGGDDAVARTLSQPRQRRFASLFYESIALQECEPWLQKLHYKSIDEKQGAEHEVAVERLAVVTSVINALLPGGVELQPISSNGVRFKMKGGTFINLSELSDGYRSFLALAMDILRHLTDVFGQELRSFTEDVPNDEPTLLNAVGKNGKRITAEGVVLIDEVDAHLHPSWQRTMGFTLQKVFPNIQFIVSTHSPFIVQAASEGGLFVLRSTPNGNSVRVLQPINSVRGWRAEAILTSELFGLEETVDTETEEILREYHRLSTKRSFGQLSQEEQDKLDQLEARVARELTAPGETMDEVRRRRDMEAYVDETIGKLRSSNAEKSL